MLEARRAPSGGPTFTTDYLGEVDGKTVLQSSQEQKAKDGRKDCASGDAPRAAEGWLRQQSE